MSPDFCGVEKGKIKAQEYWNSTTLDSGEHLDKKINTTRKFNEGIYLTDDQGNAAVEMIDFHAREKGDTPFFLYFTPNAAHFPVNAKRNVRDIIIQGQCW